MEAEQLNGGVFAAVTPEDWALIEPYLRENERHFGITVESLLTVDGEQLPPERIYRKAQVLDAGVLKESENR